jgi:thymidine kinase
MIKGALEAIVGCMSSGKSEELIRRLRRARIAKQSVMVFKPAMDTRSAAERIASRDGREFEAVAIDRADKALGLIPTRRGVVAFDEVQFFDDGILPVTRELVSRGHRVIVAGLDTDFRGEPFGFVPALLAEADNVTKLTAVCMRCGEPAIRTQRLIAGAPATYGSPRIAVGGDEMYEARCRGCHVVPERRGELPSLENEMVNHEIPR